MSNKPKKNRSARDKQLNRERTRRQAKQQTYPLHYLQPPFKGYQEWINVPERAKDSFEHPAKYDDRLDDDAKDLVDTLVKLGPRYHGIVPLAAVYLDRQIKRGSVSIAITGQPDRYREVPLAELANDLSNPDFLDQARRDYPEAGLPEQTSLITDDAAAMSIHELHINGYLILDDEHVVNMAVPPKTPGGKWILNGHDM